MPFDFDIDLDNMYPETWFGDTPGKKVCLRLCPPDKMEEFRKQCLKQKRQAVLNPETRKMELVDNSDFDSDRFTELVTQYQFVNWDLIDVKGREVDFNPENVKRMMQVPVFVEYVTGCLKELAVLAGFIKKAESKNSLSG
mgnify:CR=1 FL=1